MPGTTSAGSTQARSPCSCKTGQLPWWGSTTTILLRLRKPRQARKSHIGGATKNIELLSAASELTNASLPVKIFATELPHVRASGKGRAPVKCQSKWQATDQTPSHVINRDRHSIVAIGGAVKLSMPALVDSPHSKKLQPVRDLAFARS